MFFVRFIGFLLQIHLSNSLKGLSWDFHVLGPGGVLYEIPKSSLETQLHIPKIASRVHPLQMVPLPWYSNIALPLESGHLLPPQLGAPGRSDFSRDFRESRWVPPPPPREASPSRGVLEVSEGIWMKFGIDEVSWRSFFFHFCTFLAGEKRDFLEVDPRRQFSVK